MSIYKKEDLEGKYKGILLSPFKDEPIIIQHNFKVLNKNDIEFGIEHLTIKEEETLGMWDIVLRPKKGKTIGSIKTNMDDIDSIKESLDKLHQASNLMTLLFDSGDWWLRILSAESHTERVLKPKEINQVEEFFKKIINLEPRESNVYFRALDHFKNGITSPNKISQFLSFFNSIEYLTEELYYERYKEKIKKSKNKKEECIKKNLKHRKTVNDITREDIDSIYNTCLKVSLKDKMEVAFEKAFGKNYNKYLKGFFNKDGYYEIRNKIAHGDFSNYKREDVEIVEKYIDSLKFVAKKILIKTLDV